MCTNSYLITSKKSKYLEKNTLENIRNPITLTYYGLHDF